MNESKITVRYAKALFALAKEGNSLEAVKNDMVLLSECIREVPELQFVISSPVIKVSEKIRLFKEVFKAAFHELTSSFVNLLLEKRREEYLAGISRYFITLLKADQGIKSAELITPIPLDANLRDALKNYLAKRFNSRVEMHESVDEKLIGGFILRLDDQQIDASISSKLERIKSALTHSHS
jgi:F-type H+-transporting ATPase subunit delta